MIRQFYQHWRGPFVYHLVEGRNICNLTASCQLFFVKTITKPPEQNKYSYNCCITQQISHIKLILRQKYRLNSILTLVPGFDGGYYLLYLIWRQVIYRLYLERQQYITGLF